jgi:hypothetical protein
VGGRRRRARPPPLCRLARRRNGHRPSPFRSLVSRPRAPEGRAPSGGTGTKRGARRAAGCQCHGAGRGGDGRGGVAELGLLGGGSSRRARGTRSTGGAPEGRVPAPPCRPRAARVPAAITAASSMPASHARHRMASASASSHAGDLHRRMQHMDLGPRLAPTSLARGGERDHRRDGRPEAVHGPGAVRCAGLVDDVRLPSEVNLHGWRRAIGAPFSVHVFVQR